MLQLADTITNLFPSIGGSRAAASGLQASDNPSINQSQSQSPDGISELLASFSDLLNATVAGTEPQAGEGIEGAMIAGEEQPAEFLAQNDNGTQEKQSAVETAEIKGEVTPQTTKTRGVLGITTETIPEEISTPNNTTVGKSAETSLNIQPTKNTLDLNAILNFASPNFSTQTPDAPAADFVQLPYADMQALMKLAGGSADSNAAVVGNQESILPQSSTEQKETQGQVSPASNNTQSQNNSIHISLPDGIEIDIQSKVRQNTQQTGTAEDCEISSEQVWEQSISISLPRKQTGVDTSQLSAKDILSALMTSVNTSANSEELSALRYAMENPDGLKIILNAVGDEDNANAGAMVAALLNNAGINTDNLQQYLTTENTQSVEPTTNKDGSSLSILPAEGADESDALASESTTENTSDVITIVFSFTQTIMQPALPFAQALPISQTDAQGTSAQDTEESPASEIVFADATPLTKTSAQKPTQKQVQQTLASPSFVDLSAQNISTNAGQTDVDTAITTDSNDIGAEVYSGELPQTATQTTTTTTEKRQDATPLTTGDTATHANEQKTRSGSSRSLKSQAENTDLSLKNTATQGGIVREINSIFSTTENTRHTKASTLNPEGISAGRTEAKSNTSLKITLDEDAQPHQAPSLPDAVVRSTANTPVVPTEHQAETDTPVATRTVTISLRVPKDALTLPTQEKTTVAMLSALLNSADENNVQVQSLHIVASQAVTTGKEKSNKQSVAGTQTAENILPMPEHDVTAQSVVAQNTDLTQNVALPLEEEQSDLGKKTAVKASVTEVVPTATMPLPEQPMPVDEMLPQPLKNNNAIHSEQRRGISGLGMVASTKYQQNDTYNDVAPRPIQQGMDERSITVPTVNNTTTKDSTLSQNVMPIDNNQTISTEHETNRAESPKLTKVEPKDIAPLPIVVNASNTNSDTAQSKVTSTTALSDENPIVGKENIVRHSAENVAAEQNAPEKAATEIETALPPKAQPFAGNETSDTNSDSFSGISQTFAETNRVQDAQNNRKAVPTQVEHKAEQSNAQSIPQDRTQPIVQHGENRTGQKPVVRESVVGREATVALSENNSGVEQAAQTTIDRVPQEKAETFNTVDTTMPMVSEEALAKEEKSTEAQKDIPRQSAVSGNTVSAGEKTSQTTPSSLKDTAPSGSSLRPLKNGEAAQQEKNTATPNTVVAKPVRQEKNVNQPATTFAGQQKEAAPSSFTVNQEANKAGTLSTENTVEENTLSIIEDGYQQTDAISETVTLQPANNEVAQAPQSEIQTPVTPQQKSQAVRTTTTDNTSVPKDTLKANSTQNNSTPEVGEEQQPALSNNTTKDVGGASVSSASDDVRSEVRDLRSRTEMFSAMAKLSAQSPAQLSPSTQHLRTMQASKQQSGNTPFIPVMKEERSVSPLSLSTAAGISTFQPVTAKNDSAFDANSDSFLHSRQQQGGRTAFVRTNPARNGEDSIFAQNYAVQTPRMEAETDVLRSDDEESNLQEQIKSVAPNENPLTLRTSDAETTSAGSSEHVQESTQRSVAFERVGEKARSENTVTTHANFQRIAGFVEAPAVQAATPQRESAALPVYRIPVESFAQTTNILLRNFPANEGGSVRMVLTPETLGTVVVQMRVGEQQNLLRIEVESHEARNIIEAQLPALREQLTQSGVKMDNINVQVKQGEQSSANTAQQQGQPNQQQRYEDRDARAAFVRSFAQEGRVERERGDASQGNNRGRQQQRRSDRRKFEQYA